MEHLSVPDRPETSRGRARGSDPSPNGPRTSAAAELHYADLRAAGISRRGRGRGFSYQGRDGRRLADAGEVARISTGADGGLASDRGPAQNAPVARTLDPEGAHLAALRRLADFRGATVLEMGCGDGRLTSGIAADAAGVLAFDPDAALVETAARTLPAELAARVEFRAASAESLEVEPGSFDLVVFSWAL